MKNENKDLKLAVIKDMFNTMFNAIEDVCKESRETSLAITRLEESKMWAIKGILRESTDIEYNQ